MCVCVFVCVVHVVGMMCVICNPTMLSWNDVFERLPKVAHGLSSVSFCRTLSDIEEGVGSCLAHVTTVKAISAIRRSVHDLLTEVCLCVS